MMFSVDKYPVLRKNVLVYADNKGILLLINPFSLSPQKLSLLSEKEFLLLKQLTGRNKIKDICQRLMLKEKEISKTLKKWSSKEHNLVVFLDKPLKEEKPKKEKKPGYADILRNVKMEIISAQQAKDDQNLLKEYHQEKIKNARQQFENIERTVSHTYSQPHILLSGRNYGEAFADILISADVFRKGMNIIEVGAGTGILGKSFLERIKKRKPKVYPTIQYTFFDLSPVLLRSQRQTLKDHRRITKFIRGDIENYDFKDEKFDLIISNEMIADLNTVKLKKRDFQDSNLLSTYKKRAISLIKEFNLNISDTPKEFLFNLGAIEFLLLLKRVLKHYGKAYIVEYGSEWSYPKAKHLKDHTEYSIHFGHLKEVAEKLKLHPKIICLKDFLPFNKKMKVINEASFSLINNYLLPFLGREKIPQTVYTPQMLKKKIGKVYDALSFVGFSYVGKGGALLDPAGFLVLKLESK